jgi:Lar family restriction alleviation protein
MSELKPCPFCGGVDLRLVCLHGFWHVECRGCLCVSGMGYEEEQAIEKWNRRAESAALTAACERNGNLSVELAAVTAERDKDYAGMREMQAKFIAASQALAAALAAIKRRDEVLKLIAQANAARDAEANPAANYFDRLQHWREYIAAKLKEGV